MRMPLVCATLVLASVALAQAPPAHSFDVSAIAKIFFHPHFRVECNAFRKVSDAAPDLKRIAEDVESSDPGRSA